MKNSLQRASLAALTAATLALPAAAQDTTGQAKCAPAKAGKCGAKRCAPKCGAKCAPKG